MGCFKPFKTELGYEVPCNQCAACRAEVVNSWVFRLKAEQEISCSAYFVTLTYAMAPTTDNGYMTLVDTYKQYAPIKKGENAGKWVLKTYKHPASVGAFMKRLRKINSLPIKYLYVGEYGGKTARPHYHAIIFNVDNPNKIEKAWTSTGFGGRVHIDEVTQDSIAYCMKYIDKFKKIPLFEGDDRLKEFRHMSKGLGINWLTPELKKYYRKNLDKNYIRTRNGYKIALPRFYKNKIWNISENNTHEENMILNAELAKKRGMAERARIEKEREIDEWIKKTEPELDSFQLKSMRRKILHRRYINQIKKRTKNGKI